MLPSNGQLPNFGHIPRTNCLRYIKRLSRTHFCCKFEIRGTEIRVKSQNFDSRHAALPGKGGLEAAGGPAFGMLLTGAAEPNPSTRSTPGKKRKWKAEVGGGGHFV